jgi:6,7-dimethyl-8-ribityllumazine synthase
MTAKDTTAAALQGLALEADNLGAVQEVETQPSQEEQDAEKSMAIIEAGFQSVLVGLLKIGRAWVAKRLPEINDEWTDEALAAPAAASIPLVRKHLAGLMEIIGSSPELAALVFSCVPLALGVVTAMEKAETRQRIASAQPAPDLVPSVG